MKNIALTCLLIMSVHFSLLAQQIQTVEVEGQSEIKIKPDQSIIAIQVQHRALKASDAAQGLNKKTQEIADLIKKTKLSQYDLNTNNYQVNINRIYRKNSMSDSGYIASQTVNIRIHDLEKDLVKAVDVLGQVQDLQYSLSYLLSDDLRRSIEKDLLTQALKDAQNKVQVIQDAMDLQDLKVYKIDYKTQNNFGFPIHRQVAEYSMDASAKAMPILQPDEQKVSERVIVIYQFKN
ncbi:MAG TPA: SIMPL domain-containing protein [Anditalea sp.]|nr:SIMPL domain-containing protein [Anditalea sp.]